MAHALRRLTLAVVPFEVCAIDDIDRAGHDGDEGRGGGIAIETVGIVLALASEQVRAAHEVARSDALDGALASIVISDKVMVAATLDVAKETGSGALGFKHSTSVVVHEPPVAQTVVAQVSQGLVVVILLFHTLMITLYSLFSAYKVIKKSVKNNSAKPENRSPRVHL